MPAANARLYGDGDWIPQGTIIGGRIIGKWSIATRIFEEKMRDSKLMIVSERATTQATALPLPTGQISEVYWAEAMEGMSALSAKQRAGLAAFHAGSSPSVSEVYWMPVHMTPGHDSGTFNRFINNLLNPEQVLETAAGVPRRLIAGAENVAEQGRRAIEAAGDTAKEMSRIPLYLAIAGTVGLVIYFIWLYRS